MKVKKSRKKLIILIGVLVIIAIMVTVGIIKQSKGNLVSVQTQKALRTDVISIVSGSGRIQPRTKVSITSEVTAEVKSIPVKEGDYVSRGTALIRLETTQLQKDMESTLYAANELAARLKGARNLLDQYKDEYERQNKLQDRGMTSEQEFKKAYYLYKNQEANYAAMQEQKKAADSQLEKARDNLNKATIVAPMDGIITWIDVEVGEIAQAQTSFTQGKTLMILSDLSKFEVEAEIDETDIADLEVGQSTSVEIDAFPDTTFKGVVREISNTATTSGLGTNDQVTNFKVKIELLEIDEKIRPGMSATVDITTNEHRDVVAVPIQAVVMRTAAELEAMKEDREKAEKKTDTSLTAEEVSADPTLSETVKKTEKIKGVFINKNGIATFTRVITGIADQQNIEIIEGVAETDEVVTGSYKTLRTLKDGEKIKVEDQTGKKDNLS